MRQFIIKVGAFFTLQLGLFALLLAGYDLKYETNYLAATVDKHAILRRSVPPRILLVGGSNVAFGIDSSRLNRAFGRPVVNLGLIGGVGLDFMLDEVAPSVRAEDVVVLSLEYDLFSGGFNPVNLTQILEYRPASLRFFSFIHLRKVLLRHGLSVLGGITRRAIAGWTGTGKPGPPPDPAYVRQGFNGWGDLTNHYGRLSTFSLPREYPTHALRTHWIPNHRVLAKIGAFAQLCHSRGAHFAFTCPPHPAATVAAEKQTFHALMQALQKVPGLAILDSPFDQVYPASQFYDTGYHLTQAGTRQRTEKLIQSLAQLLPCGAPACSRLSAGDPLSAAAPQPKRSAAFTPLQRSVGRVVWRISGRANGLMLKPALRKILAA